jgi:hypothetical protein
MSNNHHSKAQARRLLAEVKVREATAADAPALTRLAELDSASPLEQPVLVAEVGGAPRAAISMLDGRLIADPFRPTGDLAALLRMRSGFAVSNGSGLGSLGRSPWRRPAESREDRVPRPSAPSVPGLPALPRSSA